MSPTPPSVGRRLAGILVAAAILSADLSCHAFVATGARPSRCAERSHSRLHVLTAADADDVVSVTVQRTLPDATPREARDAWMQFHWKKGGGLPIAILEQSSDDGENQSHQRTILPVFMKESVEYDGASGDATPLGLSYTVTESGPFFADLVPGSHSAAVTFDAASNEDTEKHTGCVMTWKVSFATSRWASIYEAVTQWTIGTAATTVQEALTCPRLFSATSTIDGASKTIAPEDARRECLDFLFAGGGLPLLPPIPYGDVLDEGGGVARRNLLRIPPLITESILTTNASDGMVEFTYRLNNPGWFTFPFLLHTHMGRVRFSTTASSDLVIEWEVEIRPYFFVSQFVEKFVEMTVATLLRNLRVRLTEPGAAVAIKPPRGNTNLLGGGTSLGEVAKDTWLGGVLDAHLSDTRSTVDQTVSILQPWTWGRSGSGDASDDVQFTWTDGHKITT